MSATAELLGNASGSLALKERRSWEALTWPCLPYHHILSFQYRFDLPPINNEVHVICSCAKTQLRTEQLIQVFCVSSDLSVCWLWLSNAGGEKPLSRKRGGGGGVKG